MSITFSRAEIATPDRSPRRRLPEPEVDAAGFPAVRLVTEVDASRAREVGGAGAGGGDAGGEDRLAAGVAAVAGEGRILRLKSCRVTAAGAPDRRGMADWGEGPAGSLPV